MTIRVVLAEDNLLVREGVRALLESYGDIELVGFAEDAPHLLAAAAQAKPDVVVTDIKMPPHFRLEGIDAAHQIRSEHPETGVVVVSAHDDVEYAIALLGKGHRGLGYLLKDRIAEGDELVRAIREVASGGSIVDPVIADRLSSRGEAQDEERRILSLMAEGKGYGEIAEVLGTTQEAVDHRVTACFRRLAGEPGEAQLVDEFKRLHMAVIEREASTRALSSFVPDQVARRLTASPSEPITPQEVVVSVLFSDIRSFSTLAEMLSAREVAEIVTRYLSEMATVVSEHGGTLDKFAGDSVMAIFGAPEAVPDHAAQALRCALAMQARQQELNAEPWSGNVDALEIGIGVNTGQVIAGTVGGGGRLDYTVVGDAVNVAERVQSQAAGGEVLASAAAVAAAPEIDFELVGPRQVKGRREWVELYRILRPTATPSDRDRRPTNGGKG